VRAPRAAASDVAPGGAKNVDFECLDLAILLPRWSGKSLDWYGHRRLTGARHRRRPRNVPGEGRVRRRRLSQVETLTKRKIVGDISSSH